MLHKSIIAFNSLTHMEMVKNHGISLKPGIVKNGVDEYHCHMIETHAFLGISTLYCTVSDNVLYILCIFRYNSRMDTEIFLRDNLENFTDKLVLAGLFEYIPNIYLYVKNDKSQFLHVNQNFAELLGVTRMEEVIGKTDHDFFPRHLADEYRKEDIGVIQGTIQVIEKIWLVSRPNKQLDWFFSTKLPVSGKKMDATGCESAGLVGYIRDCKKSKLGFDQDFVVKKATDFMFENYSQPVSVKELAKLCHLSVSQMNRRFHQACQMSPKQFLLNVRLKIASQLLATSDEPITSIVVDTGFFDQSHFSRYFRRSFGMSPNEYRNQYRGILTQ